MDPDALLADMIALAVGINDEYYECRDLISDAEQLAYGLVAIDKWLTDGGFLPARWVNPGA